MLGIHRHQIRWDEIWPLLHQFLVSIEAVIESYSIFRLRVCLADKQGLKPVLERRHEDICFVVSIDPGAEDEFTMRSKILRECLFEKRLTANNESLRNFRLLCHSFESTAEIWVNQRLGSSNFLLERGLIARVPSKNHILPVGQRTALLWETLPRLAAHNYSIEPLILDRFRLLRGITHIEAVFSREIVDRLGELGFLGESLEMFEVLLDYWPGEATSEANASIFRVSNNK